MKDKEADDILSRIKNWQLTQTLTDVIGQAAHQPLTQSEIMTRASCARKWFYRYGLQINRRGYLDLNLLYGDIIHKLLAKLYMTDEDFAYPPEEKPIELDENEKLLVEVDQSLLTPTDREDLIITLEKVRIAFDAYRRHYYTLDQHLDIAAVEQPFSIDYEGYELVGKIDMVAKPNSRDGDFIWDWKSTSKLDALILDTWAFRFQFLYYCWLYWKITEVKPLGIMVQGLLKPALRPKQVGTKAKGKRMETRQEYLFRVEGDMSVNRERYFYRQRLPLGKGVLERFEREELLPHLNAFGGLREASVDTMAGMSDTIINGLGMTMNTGQCHVYGHYCEYLHLCKDGPVALGEYDKRKSKHPELDGNDNSK